MNRLALICLSIQMMLIQIGVASDKVPSVADHPVPEILLKEDKTPEARAFAGALEKLRELSLGSFYGANWPRKAADTRLIAKQLAKTNGKKMAPIVKKYARADPSLAIVTLDELGLFDDAVDLAADLFSFDSGLTPVSICSRQTREIAANRLARLLSEGTPHVPSVYDLGFLVAVGDADTVRLLRVCDQRLQGHLENHGTEAGRRRRLPSRPYKWAADRITARLELPNGARRQREKDELLFWQTEIFAPKPITHTDYPSSARFLVEANPGISSGFLVEHFALVSKGTLPLSPVAIEIVVAQRENAAIPAMVGLVKRNPEYRDRVENALKEIGSPEAEKGLQEIDAYCW